MNRLLPAALCALCLPVVGLCQLTDGYVRIPSMSSPQHVVGVENYVVYKTRAFAVGSPILVSGPAVSKATWSPDGQFLLFEQWRTDSNVATAQSAILDDKPPKPEVYLCVYSLSDGKVSDVSRLDEDQQEDDIQWMPGSDKALVVLTKNDATDDASRPAAKLYILDAAGGSIKEFSPWGPIEGDPESIDLSVSPTQGYAFISGRFREADKGPNPVVRGGQTTKTSLMTADELYVPVNVPDGFKRIMPVWSEDGMTAYVIASGNSDPSGPKSAWYVASLVDGRLSKSGKPTSIYTGVEQTGLITVRDLPQNSTNQKVTKAINTLWLETLDPDSQNRMMLAGDATNGAVNKTLQAASYLSQGSLYVRPIVEVPRSRFDEELAAWNRTQAMLRARQAGLAFLMYAADNDDTFPGIKEKWEELLGPYLRDSSALGGFVYSFPGGPINDIRDPSNTQLGYLDQSDGRAVVYVDGHVKWVPKS